MTEETSPNIQEALAKRLLVVVRFIPPKARKMGYAPDGQDVAAVIHRRSCKTVPTTLVDEGQCIEIGQECLARIGCWVLFANQEDAHKGAEEYAMERYGSVKGNITVEPLTCCRVDS